MFFQVSGEYAMLYHAAQAGAIDLRGVLEEVLLSMRRAGKYTKLFNKLIPFSCS